MTENLEQKFAEFCKNNGLEYCSTRRSKYRTLDRDHYFTLHRNLYDRMMENFEDIEFDYETMFKAEFDVDMNAILTDEMVEFFEIDAEDAAPYIGQPISAVPEDIFDVKWEYANNFDYYDVVNEARSVWAVLLGIDEDEIERYCDEQYESLAYWTIYFEPRHFDVETAVRCGLTPFSYDEMDLLALGGGGMDLSPKLDAYQALMDGTIPTNSQFFQQVDYFDYVSRVKSTEIEPLVRRNFAEVVFRAEMTVNG